MKRHNIITFIIMLALALPAFANNKPAKQLLLQKYKEELSTATTARDSLRVLYYLFDLSDRQGQKEYAWDIYNTACRAEDINAQLDMLRNLGTFYAKNDSIVELLLKLSEKIPNAEAKAATKTYILNQQINAKSNKPDDTKLQMMLLDSITKSHNLEGTDIYDRISILYQIIQYLGVDADGVLFKQCLDAYAKMIDELPASDYPLKNQFYTTAAMIHSRINGNPQKAVEYDKKLLEIIDHLQQMYVKKKRNFRNYDTNKFISYRRMMSNYSALSDEEIETIHDSIQALYERNSDVRRTMDHNGQAFAFYYMASKDYKNAIPALLAILKQQNISAYMRQKYYGMIMEASKAIGDKDNYIMAMEQFIDQSKVIDSLRKITMRREIMLRDSIIPKPLLYLDTVKTNKKDSRTSRPQTTWMVISSVLALLLIIYAILYLRLRVKKSDR
ncbi:MAG: hypothetical protein K2K32_07185 [Muribaculaceae bacterium]|nr:hypothetical protein [Muribaculaceae bacterium]